MLTDRDTLRRLLAQYQLRPNTNAGQHFLIDPTVVQASVAAANIQPTDTILEIGSGVGALTEALVATGASVMAIEQDARLAAALPEILQQPKNLQVIQGDALRVELAQHVTDGQFKVVANLPYQITAQVLRQFLSQRPRPSCLVLLIQKEVAERLTGASNNRSTLTVLAQLTSQVEFLRVVDRTSFQPAPAVTSAIVRLTLNPELSPDLEPILRLARMAFAGRRKQLKNSLAAGLKISMTEVEKCLQKANLDPTIRPQMLTADDWRKLYQVFVDTGHSK